VGIFKLVWLGHLKNGLRKVGRIIIGEGRLLLDNFSLDWTKIIVLRVVLLYWLKGLVKTLKELGRVGGKGWRWSERVGWGRKDSPLLDWRSIKVSIRRWPFFK